MSDCPAPQDTSKSDCKPKRGALSDQILDYYYKYGQNRNIEKYLRVRRSASNSSSDNSDTRSLGQHGSSIDNTMFLSALRACNHSTPVESREFKEQSIVSDLGAGKSEKENQQQAPKDAAEQAASTSGESSKTTRPSTKKKTNARHPIRQLSLNLESSVEIHVPVAKAYFGRDMQSQTCFIDSSDIPLETIVESPIRAVRVESKKNPDYSEAGHINSPVSSVASNKVRLEWDSMADVGYEKNKTDDSIKMNTTEKNALKHFFSQHGLDSDSKMLVIGAKKDVQQNKNEQCLDQRAAEKVLSEITQSHENFHAPTDDKSSEFERCQSEPNNLSEFKEKSGCEQMSSSVDESSIEAEIQKREDIGTQTSFDRKTVVASIDEKSSQTSYRRLSSKSLQTEEVFVDQVPTEPSSNNTGPPDTAQSRATENNLTSADSFEFLSAAHYERRHISERKESVPPRKSLLAAFQNAEADLTNEYCTNTIDSDLHRGLKILSSLASSKSLSRSKKKLLARKIVEKMLRSNSDETNEDSTEPSNSNSTSEISIYCAVQEQNEQSSVDSETRTEQHQFPAKSCSRESPVGAVQPVSGGSKSWLQPMTHSEVDYEIYIILNDKQQKSKRNDDRRIEKSTVKASEAVITELVDDLSANDSDKLSWIDAEIDHLKKLKELLREGKRNNKKKLDELQAETKSVAAPFPAHQIGETSNASSLRAHYSRPLKNKFPSWNSHMHMQNALKERSKLKTPSSDESIGSFANHKTRGFMAKYKHDHGTLFTTKRLQSNASDHYSEALANPKTNSTVSSRPLTLPKSRDNTSTIVSSDEFLSSNSVTIPEMADSSSYPGSGFGSRPVCHQRRSKETQTTESVLKSYPIFGVRRPVHCCSNLYSCVCNKKTVRTITTSTTNKQQQKFPSPIAYVLSLKPQTSDGASRSLGTTDSEIPSLTLEDYLKQNRPRFLEHAEQRRHIIMSVSGERCDRNKKKNEIMTTASDHSIDLKMHHLPQLKKREKSIMSTKELKQRSQRIYKNLPEVIRKREQEKKEKLMRRNILFSKIYNKNIQKEVLKGKTSLPQTLVIPSH